MQQNTILTASPINGEAVVLNEDTYQSLKGMINSSDESDHKMAQLILNGCDIEKSIYWIWKLSKGYKTTRMVNLRTKASRAFRDHSRLFYICQKNERSFAEFLASQKWLTPEIYQKLEEDIVNRTLRQCNNQFYDVTMTIKEEYKHLALNVEPIKYNDND